MAFYSCFSSTRMWESVCLSPIAKAKLPNQYWLSIFHWRTSFSLTLFHGTWLKDLLFFSGKQQIIGKTLYDVDGGVVANKTLRRQNFTCLYLHTWTGWYCYRLLTCSTYPIIVAYSLALCLVEIIDVTVVVKYEIVIC